MTYAYLIEIMRAFRRGETSKIAMACAIGLWQVGGAKR